jgi:hypothetical protein
VVLCIVPPSSNLCEPVRPISPPCGSAGYYPEYYSPETLTSSPDSAPLLLKSCHSCPNGAVCCACDGPNSRDDLMQNLKRLAQPCEVCAGGGPPIATYGHFMSSTLCNKSYFLRRNVTTCGSPIGVECPLGHGDSCVGDSECDEGYASLRCGLGCNVWEHVAIGCSGCRYVGLRCGQCDEHFFMLMHSCHECGEPWAIWLCGVILPLLFLAGCVGFLWFESGHQTRCLIDRRRRCPAVCLVVHSCGCRCADSVCRLRAVDRAVCFAFVPAASWRPSR